MRDVFLSNELLDLFLGSRIACRGQVCDQIGNSIDFAHITTSRKTLLSH